MFTTGMGRNFRGIDGAGEQLYASPTPAKIPE